MASGQRQKMHQFSNFGTETSDDFPGNVTIFDQVILKYFRFNCICLLFLSFIAETTLRNYARGIEYGSSEDEKASLLQQLHMTGLEKYTNMRVLKRL